MRLTKLVLLSVVLMGATFSKASGATVGVDPRTELMLVMQVITGYEGTGLITRYDVSYLKEIKDTFSKYDSEPGAQYIYKLERSGLSFDRAAKAFLCLGPDRNLTQSAALPEDLMKVFPSPSDFEDFQKSVKGFADTSGFWKFYDSHRALYERLAKDVRTSGGESVIDALQNYTGMALSNAHVVLMTVGHDGGFGPHILRKDGTEEVYAVIGPDNAQDGLPQYGNKRRLASLIWHEFAHTLVNPQTSAHAALAEKSKDAMSLVAKRMSAEAYDTWSTIVNEHIVRAIVIRLNEREFGHDAGLAEEIEQIFRGFVYIPELCRGLEEFEKLKGTTLKVFFPNLLNRLEHCAAVVPH